MTNFRIAVKGAAVIAVTGALAACSVIAEDLRGIPEDIEKVREIAQPETRESEEAEVETSYIRNPGPEHEYLPEPPKDEDLAPVVVKNMDCSDSEKGCVPDSGTGNKYVAYPSAADPKIWVIPVEDPAPKNIDENYQVAQYIDPCAHLTTDKLGEHGLVYMSGPTTALDSSRFCAFHNESREVMVTFTGDTFTREYDSIYEPQDPPASAADGIRVFGRDDQELGLICEAEFVSTQGTLTASVLDTSDSRSLDVSCTMAADLIEYAYVNAGSPEASTQSAF